MAKTRGRDAGMEAKGCETTGACATLVPKHRSQPQRAKVCSGPQTLPCGQGSSHTHSLALRGGACQSPSMATTSNWVCPPENSLGLLFLIAHHLVNSPAPSKHQHLMPEGFGGLPLWGRGRSKASASGADETPFLDREA